MVGASAYIAWSGVRSVVPSEPWICSASKEISRSVLAIVNFTAAMSVRHSRADDWSIFHAVSSTNRRSMRSFA